MQNRTRAVQALVTAVLTNENLQKPNGLLIFAKTFPTYILPQEIKPTLMMTKRLFATAALALSLLGLSAQSIEIDRTTVDCGEVLFQSPVTAEFQMRNSGTQPIAISQVRTDCGCTRVIYPTAEIAPGQTFTVSAVYDARTLGRFVKRIAVYSNGSTEHLDLTIRGRVVAKKDDFAGEYPFQIDDICLDQNNIEFDNVNRGDHPSQVIHLRNGGTETVEPVVMHLPTYLKASVTPRRLAPGRTGRVTITLDSEQLRDLGLTQTALFLGSFPGDKVGAEKAITVSTVLLPGFENMTETQRMNAPKIRFSAGAIDLPDFAGKAKSRGEMTITNEGNSTLEIRSLQMFTTGIQVSLGSRQLKPGESTKLKVTAVAKDLKTARSKPRILMITNDPENTKVTININVK